MAYPVLKFKRGEIQFRPEKLKRGVLGQNPLSRANPLRYPTMADNTSP